MSNKELDGLRNQLDDVNLQLLHLINQRAELVQEIGRVKEKQGVNRYDPVRERTMLILSKPIIKDRLILVRLNIFSKKSLNWAWSCKRMIRRRRFLYQENKKLKTRSSTSRVNW